MSGDTARTQVSVVIPCFNMGAFVDEAVQSVVEQTYQPVEILVVDDGSTDAHTHQRLSALESRSDVTVIRSANGGLSAARNLGIRRARGQYISALDADDRLRPAWLERAVDVLDEHPELAFVSHWVHAFGDQTFDWTPGRSDLGALLDHNVFNGAALVRRTVIESVGGFDESMRDGCEDWEFWLRVTERGFTGTILPELLYDYRQRGDSMSRQMHEQGAFQHIYARMVEAHRPSFERHLTDLILRRDWAFADVCRRIDDLQVEVTTMFEPAVAQARHELSVARARLAEAQAHEALVRATESAGGADDLAAAREDLAAAREDLAASKSEAERLRAQMSDLRGSLSWRLTAPLRRAYEALGLGKRSTGDR